MATTTNYKLVLVFNILLFFGFASGVYASNTKDVYGFIIVKKKFGFAGYQLYGKHYIVYMGEHSYPDSESLISANHEMLASVTGSIDEARNSTVHHYSKSFRGFSAMLMPEQADQLAKRESVISVFESKNLDLHTTRSWDFLGQDSSGYFDLLALDKQYDVIIGHLDSGVWPESISFSDNGLGPVPKRFKGGCIAGDQFTSANCNRKIIGVRYYYRGFEAQNGPLENFRKIFFRSARDDYGHGSHTASTAAGSLVNVRTPWNDISTARGGAPGARLAVYKVCWFNYCNCADVIAGFDDAIDDGVDIITLSLGQPPTDNFFDECFAMASFHAFKNGILVSAAAGNDGDPGTVANGAPWILTVGASSTDRHFISDIFLGNGKELRGFSLNQVHQEGYKSLIAASKAAAPGVPLQEASLCKRNTLDPRLIQGKIVVCSMQTKHDDKKEKALVINQGGGAGMIVLDPNGKETFEPFVIPTSLIGLEESQELQAYLSTNSNPVAAISQTRAILNSTPAPKIAAFSSRGPNKIAPDIIKPDIIAPGLNILAAWTAAGDEASKSVYYIDYGTSMACPHVTAAAVILKAIYRSWSPAALKSALMTTATWLDNTRHNIQSDDGTPATPFDYGSGHMKPDAALDPGLVYDFDVNDIVDFLCATGANHNQLEYLMGHSVACKNPPIPPYNLNYPSIAVANMNGPVSVYRTVTYQGSESYTVYTVSVEVPAGVEVRVVPDRLQFSGRGMKASFRVDFVPLQASNGKYVFGGITWSNGLRKVNSPIAIRVVSV